MLTHRKTLLPLAVLWASATLTAEAATDAERIAALEAQLKQQQAVMQQQQRMMETMNAELQRLKTNDQASSHAAGSTQLDCGHGARRHGACKHGDHDRRHGDERGEQTLDDGLRLRPGRRHLRFQARRPELGGHPAGDHDSHAERRLWQRRQFRFQRAPVAPWR